MIKKNWNVKVNGKGQSASDIYNKLKMSRGISDIGDFFRPSTGNILPYTDLHNIDDAANVFIDGIQNGLKFTIYADVDADGCSSAAIIYHYLRRFGIYADTYINKGKVHGVQPEFVPSADTNIIIIVDSINNEMSEYRRLLDQGFKLIVLDHHVPSMEVIDFQKDINLVSSANCYGNPHLSGSGVCYKFINYIDSLLNTNYAVDYADLASVGIIADVCSVGPESMENRAICQLGFNCVGNIGLVCLLGKDTMNSNDIGFSIGPLINAANRMDKNDLALKLFLTENRVEAKNIIKELTKVKETQKKLATEFFNKMEEQADSQLNKKCMWFVVPDDVGNLTGLLATKATAKYHRPCVVLHYNEERGEYAGSMRAEGIDNFSKIINESPFFAECNGHENSAGIVIAEEAFSQLMVYVECILKDYVFSTDYIVDLQLERMQVTPFLLNKLYDFNRISGKDFEPICCLIENVKNYSVRKMSQGKHICVEVPDMKFIVWNFTDWENVIETSDGMLSAIGTLEESTFMGKTTTQMLMEDYHFELNNNGTKSQSLWW